MKFPTKRCKNRVFSFEILQISHTNQVTVLLMSTQYIYMYIQYICVYVCDIFCMRTIAFIYLQFYFPTARFLVRNFAPHLFVCSLYALCQIKYTK